MEVIVVVATIAVAIAAIIAAYYITQLRFERKFHQWQATEALKWQEDKAKSMKGAISLA